MINLELAREWYTNCIDITVLYTSFASRQLGFYFSLKKHVKTIAYSLTNVFNEKGDKLYK